MANILIKHTKALIDGEMIPADIAIKDGIILSMDGAPEGFVIHVQDIRISAGAGFIVVLTGSIMTMPGLPKKPAAELIDVSDDGVISGLF